MFFRQSLLLISLSLNMVRESCPICPQLKYRPLLLALQSYCFSNLFGSLWDAANIVCSVYTSFETIFVFLFSRLYSSTTIVEMYAHVVVSSHIVWIEVIIALYYSLSCNDDIRIVTLNTPSNVEATVSNLVQCDSKFTMW